MMILLSPGGGPIEAALSSQRERERERKREKEREREREREREKEREIERERGSILYLISTSRNTIVSARGGHNVSSRSLHFLSCRIRFNMQ
jgi:hypothetical protein